MQPSPKQMEPHQQQHQLQRKKRASNHRQYTGAGGSEIRAGNISYGSGEGASSQNSNNYLTNLQAVRSQLHAQQAYEAIISSQQQVFNSNPINLSVRI